MATATTISEQAFHELASTDPDRAWELWDGVPVEKPEMSAKHNAVAFLMGHFLQSQLDWREFLVNVNGDRARISPRASYIPDVMVIPAAYRQALAQDPLALGVYADALPFVAEVWSPSTGHYDIATKLRGYQERGDEEIWYVHSLDHTLTASRRQPDGSYTETIYTGGIVPVLSLPGVTIALDALFAV